jgi:hypothetical protein
MANEAVCIIAPTKIVTRVCAEGTTIPKGTILKLSGTNTVAASSADNDVFGGIAIEEFTGGEGLTHIGVAMDGVFDIKTAGTITRGAVVNISGANEVNTSAAGDLLTGSVVGYMEETGDGGLNRVRLRGY